MRSLVQSDGWEVFDWRERRTQLYSHSMSGGGYYSVDDIVAATDDFARSVNPAMGIPPLSGIVTTWDIEHRLITIFPAFPWELLHVMAEYVTLLTVQLQKSNHDRLCYPLPFVFSMGNNKGTVMIAGGGEYECLTIGDFEMVRGTDGRKRARVCIDFEVTVPEGETDDDTEPDPESPMSPLSPTF
jgi:hypothetical protein